MIALSKPVSSELTADRLRELLDYDRETGFFHWRQTEGGRRKQGRRAGHVIGKYRYISIDGKIFGEHRLALLYVNGRWPQPEVDHKDTIGTNNAYENLREATRSQNQANTRIPRDSTTGAKGVSFEGGKWRARITRNSTVIHLGLFSTVEAAAAAYREAAIRLHGEFARTE